MNWGTKLTIGMLLFMGFIVTLVTLMIKPHKADSLIENDYYEKGQTYDRDYNASQNASTDRMIPVIKTDDQNVSFNFPAPVSYEILFRRLADAKMDRTFESDSAQTTVLVPRADLKSGSWLLRIEYKANQKEYLYQDKILLP